MLDSAVGVNEAVALMSGVTHDWIVESPLSAVRKEVQDDEMLEGMRVESDCGVSHRHADEEEER